MTDVSASSVGCGQVHSIDLTRCSNVTDEGTSALGARCGQLQSIDLKRCSNVTDAGMSALSAGVVSCRASILHAVVM